MFVTLTDFNTPPYNLSNLTSGNFDAFRDQEEEAILRMVLGDGLYADFIAGLVLPWSAVTDYAVNALVASGDDVYKSLQTPNIDHPVTDVLFWVLDHADDEWLLLKNGSGYDYMDKAYRYSGLKALLIPFIYSRWTEVKDERNSGIGMVRAKGENADVVSSADKVASSWQAFARLVGVTRSDNHFDPIDTLAGFLWVNKDADYVDWRFKSPGRKNTFNL